MEKLRGLGIEVKMRYVTRIIGIYYIIFLTFANANMYEDGNSEDTSKWVLYGNGNGKTNIYNIKEGNNRVINLTDEDVAYRLDVDYGSFEAESSLLRWKIKQSTSDYGFYIIINTDNGQRVLNYTNRPYNANFGTRFEIGLSNSISIGEWNTIERNLASDLALFEPHNHMVSLEAFLVEGVFLIDDIERVATTPIPTPTPINSMLAFPHAEGGGANSTGGRGGRVIEVTNLNASGEGSFREACEASGARTVVFRVGGTIDLGGENIVILHDNITVAGQTATGDGIQIKNGGLVIKASEVIVRYLRLRPGPAYHDVDALNIQSPTRHNRQRNIIIDHISAFWAVDENIDSGSFSDNITIQWSIIAEGLHNSIHREGIHSRGIMITENSRNVTLHHNLIYRNYKRNPLIQSSDADVVNNIMVNTKHQVFIQPFSDKVHVNFVGNYFRSYDHTRPPIRVYDYGTGYDAQSGVYYHDNYDEYFRPHSTDSQYDIRVLHQHSNQIGHIQDKSNRYPFALVSTQLVEDAYLSVLESAGANYPQRDNADQRVIAKVRSGNAPPDFVDHPNDVGGWPTLVGGEALLDSDHDGMPDIWEINHGLNPYDSIDRNSKNLTPEGYTNLEVYINGLIP